MNHPYAQKIPRNHPQVQDRQMLIEGFQDFAFKAFDPRYEKSAAPLSKRTNGVGPIKNGEGVFFGNVPLGYSQEITMANGALALGLIYFNSIGNALKKGKDNTLDTIKAVSSLTAIRYVATGAIAYAVINDFNSS